ncbi:MULTISPECIES: extracellular solute-binding protein [Glycomyces]|uniref:Aldouronate transport system substrate-binding protein n=2 Tax=Glycomyces TaxID=58113 RepID=A0A9X3PJM8_9ACTN|nr:extracellular solute-binding protein [Glycomyces lechevalierae]MDA1386067.1 extracellular solute-binding protein [Glycomyces lechevalierae]MDR7340775.1 putative aldouronate transport system substrate-binding protein [Glycomyces lechevalierae]
MATPSNGSIFRRRSLLKAAGLGAAGAAGLPLIAACSDIQSSEGSTQVTEGFDFLPQYKEWPLPVEPDLVGEPPNHRSGFTAYPEPAQAIPEPPANAGAYRITVPTWGTPPPSDDSYFAAVQEAWGGTVIELAHADGNTYAETSNQWLQAGEFGDGIHMFSWMLGAHPNFRETVVNRFYDLTDILTGDISERWPLLAGRATEAWGKSVWSSDPEDPESARLYGIPGSLAGGPQNGMYVRTDLLEAADLAVPTTVDEVLEVARTWSDDAAGRWAFYGLDYLTPQWFGLASGNGWAWIDGKLVHNCERPEYTEWLEFRRTVWDEKLIHPDAPTASLDPKELHKAGTTLFHQDGMSYWGDFSGAVTRGEIEGAVVPLGPVAAGGRTPVVFGTADVEGWLFLSKSLSAAQVEEILDVANFCAAPFGTIENQLLDYGIEGEHFEFDAEGVPRTTDHGSATIGGYYGISGKVQLFHTGDPVLVQQRFDYDASVLDYLEKDLFEGIRVEAPADFISASQTLKDQEADVVYGRSEIADIPAMVETFLTNGGEAARAPFTDAYKIVNGE